MPLTAADRADLDGSLPILLSCSGLDPTGGAGLQADVEAAAAQGVRVVCLPTALTVQDSNNVFAVEPLPVGWLDAAARVLLADVRPHAVKLGLLGSVEQVQWLAQLIVGLDVPVVLDPVLRAGGGKVLADAPLVAAMREQLFPLTTVLTPNADEARALTGCTSVLEAGVALLGMGVRHVLVTGGDEPGLPSVDAIGEEETCNWHCAAGHSPQRHAWPRIAARFHGAGCTLAASIAALLARGHPVPEALREAQAYTHETLRRAQAVGRGRLLPRRHW